MPIALSDRAVESIAGYVRGGGLLVADHGPAFYDEQLVRRPQPALDELFALSGRSYALRDRLVHEGRPAAAARLRSGAAAAEVGIAGGVAEPVAGFRVHIENVHGRGKAIYLNLAVCEYAAVRLDPERHRTARDLRVRLRRILFEASIAPPLTVRGAGLPTCIERLVLRARDGRRLLAVRLNALDDPGRMQEIGERGPRPVELRFPEPVGLVDLTTGRDLGVAAKFETVLDPWRALLFEVRPGG